LLGGGVYKRAESANCISHYSGRLEYIAMHWAPNRQAMLLRTAVRPSTTARRRAASPAVASKESFQQQQQDLSARGPKHQNWLSFVFPKKQE
jgi:hypothetical protein